MLTVLYESHKRANFAVIADYVLAVDALRSLITSDEFARKRPSWHVAWLVVIAWHARRHSASSIHNDNAAVATVLQSLLLEPLCMSLSSDGANTNTDIDELCRYTADTLDWLAVFARIDGAARRQWTTALLTHVDVLQRTVRRLVSSTSANGDTAPSNLQQQRITEDDDDKKNERSESRDDRQQQQRRSVLLQRILVSIGSRCDLYVKFDYV
jgi:hypothetical protein